MDTADGMQGAKPGETFAEMRAKSQAGQLKSKDQYQPGDCAGAATTRPSPRMAGQGTGVVQKAPINSSRTGNNPYERQTAPAKSP